MAEVEDRKGVRMVANVLRLSVLRDLRYSDPVSGAQRVEPERPVIAQSTD